MGEAKAAKVCREDSREERVGERALKIGKGSSQIFTRELISECVCGNSPRLEEEPPERIRENNLRAHVALGIV